MKIFCVCLCLAAAVLLEAAQLRTVPGFVSVSIHLDGLTSAEEKDFSSTVTFCRKGEKVFRKALPLIYNAADKSARGVVVNLQENTGYELKISYNDNGKKGSLSHSFKTKTGNVPVARTVMLTKENWKGTLCITESGSPDGYIRYTSPAGTILDCSGKRNAFDIRGKYIILENLIIRDPVRNGIVIEKASNIIIRNCDIGQFGRVGVWIPEKRGRFWEGKRYLNSDSGIIISKSSDILVERCYIHDAKGHSNSWFYSHPAGPRAVYVQTAGAVTMRYNDFIGGDRHRYNDVIESLGNGLAKGGFYRDAEIYGNYLALANDDGIELDGGQRNARFFRNRIEGAFCGVSTGCCVDGPSFIFENLICNMGDEFGCGASVSKNSFGRFGNGAVRLFNNTMTGISGMSSFSRDMHKGYLKFVGLNNIFVVKNSYITMKTLEQAKTVVDYTLHDSANGAAVMKKAQSFGQDKHSYAADPRFVNTSTGDYRLKKSSPGFGKGCRIDNFMEHKKVNIGAFQTGSADLPYRPLPLYTDKSFITFSCAALRPEYVTVTADKKTSFRIFKNDEFSFFEVFPDSGTVVPGKPFKLTVKVRPDKLTQARINRGAFFVRRADGFSRPVGISVDSRMVKSLLAADRRDMVYGKLVSKTGKDSVFEFDMPESGVMFLAVFSQTMDRKYKFSVDGKTYDRTSKDRRFTGKPIWRNAYNISRDGNTIGLKLKKGKVRITLHNCIPEAAALIPRAECIMFNRDVK